MPIQGRITANTRDTTVSTRCTRKNAVGLPLVNDRGSAAMFLMNTGQITHDQIPNTISVQDTAFEAGAFGAVTTGVSVGLFGSADTTQGSIPAAAQMTTGGFFSFVSSLAFVRTSARTPIAVLVLTLCALVITVPAVSAAPAAPPTTAPTTAPAASCVPQAAPGPPVDASEVPKPGQTAPPPLTEPKTAVGGSALDSCGLVLPPGAPPLPTDIAYDSWVIQDLDTGAVLAAKDPHARERPASLIKMLLALVATRTLDPNQVIAATQDDANAEGTRVGIGPGGQYPVSLLLHGLLMASGNDIAHALAMAMGGMQVTVNKMNALAQQLGALDTRAATPSGLDGPGMATSAYDLSLFLRAALATPVLADAMSTVKIQFPGYGGKPSFTVYNDNHLLTKFKGDFGGKTGYTDDAQHTYANAAAQNGHRIGLIMMHGTNHLDGMYQNANELMNYGFALVDAHTAAVGQLVSTSPAPLTALANSAGLAGHPGGATNTTGASVPPPPVMSTFGNVGGPLTALACVIAVLIVIMAVRRQRAKLARERRRLAERKAMREAVTVRVAPVARPGVPANGNGRPAPNGSVNGRPVHPGHPSVTTATGMTGPIWPTQDMP